MSNLFRIYDDYRVLSLQKATEKTSVKTYAKNYLLGMSLKSRVSLHL